MYSAPNSSPRFRSFATYICSMQVYLRVFFWGMLISFLGCLPLSTLNITAMQIGIQEHIADALWFSFGALLIEMIYVRISLVGISWVRRQVKLMKLLEWLTLVIIIALAAGSFYAASLGNTQKTNAVLDNPIHRFLLGMMMSAVNPVQIPFWFGWSTVLFTKKILAPVPAQYNIYILGIGTGTMLGNCVFIFGGNWLVQQIQNSQQKMNWIIGGIFALTAVIQLVKMLMHKDEISRFENKGN